MRSTYGSLKGLFVSGLSVPMHLSFDDAVSALVNIQRGSAAVVKGGERGMVDAVTALVETGPSDPTQVQVRPVGMEAEWDAALAEKTLMHYLDVIIHGS